MKKLLKTFRINFFRTLKISKSLATVWISLTQQKQLSLSKNRELCGILAYPSPIPCFSAQPVAMKISALIPHTRGNKGPSFERLAIIYSDFGGSLEDKLKGFVLITWSNAKAASHEAFIENLFRLMFQLLLPKVQLEQTIN